MSGGHFDYQQYHLANIADQIDQLIVDNNKKDDWGYAHGYSLKTISRFKEAAHTLRQAHSMAQRVDWLASSDDGEDSFHERWKEEVLPYWKDEKVLP